MYTLFLPRVGLYVTKLNIVINCQWHHKFNRS